MQQPQNLNILMVDDDSLDVEIFQRSLKKSGIPSRFHTAVDGQEALEFLENGEVSKPWLILLDLNMPRMNGLEFLASIRANEKLNDSVVFVMTTSDDEQDKDAAYRYNIAGYLVKSELGSNYNSAAKLVDIYTKTCELPTSH